MGFLNTFFVLQKNDRKALHWNNKKKNIFVKTFTIFKIKEFSILLFMDVFHYALHFYNT